LAALAPRLDAGTPFVLAPSDRPLSQQAHMQERWFEVDSPPAGGVTGRVFGADKEEATATITVAVLYDAKRDMTGLRNRMASDRDLIRVTLQNSENYADNVHLMTFQGAQDVPDPNDLEFIRRILT